MSFYPFVFIWVPSEAETETLLLGEQGWESHQPWTDFLWRLFFFLNIRNEYTSSLFKAQLFWILITYNQSSVQFSSVQSLSRVQLFATPWTTPHQASLSITNSRSPPKPNFIPTNSESYQDWEDLQDKFNSKATANTLRWAREAEVFPNQRRRNEVNEDSGPAMSPNGANRM